MPSPDLLTRSKWFAILGVILLIANPTAALALDEAATLALLVRTIQKSESDDVRSSLMKGMLRGLEGRRDVQPPDAWQSLAAELASSDDPSIRDAANRLSQIFGDTAATERALATLRDPLAPDSQRKAALASLVSQRDSNLAEELESLLDVDALRLDAIRAYAVIATQDAPKILLARYATSAREAQSATVETLATRKAYAKELVRAINDQTVPRDHIPSYIARTLGELLGQQFTAVYGEIPELEKNVSERIAKFKRLITDEALAKADARRGRVVFQKTCGACHLMYGAGGKVGPDLTGSNRANLDYFLLNSVDPSGDVPEGYRTQLVQTVDGRVLTGVLAEEDNRRIVLKTVDQPRVVIAKDEIEARKVSEKSMMPEGQLEQLPREDLFDLVKYMQTKSQVEAAE